MVDIKTRSLLKFSKTPLKFYNNKSIQFNNKREKNTVYIPTKSDPIFSLTFSV